MAERMDQVGADAPGRSPGTRAAALVRGLGAGTADVTEQLGRVGASALAAAVRSTTRAWGDVLGATIDGVLAAVALPTRQGAPPGAPRSQRPGVRACVDLIDVRTPDQIDRALAEGLAAAAPSRRSRAMG